MLRYISIIAIIMGLLPVVLFAQTERWVYTYKGIADASDVANSVVYGLDGNIYTAGYSYGQTASGDFTIISLTSSGGENWVYGIAVDVAMWFAEDKPS